MSYKVFFVEDEIVTREGIRDNVDWGADGFELCGEAPDGEMALPLVQQAQPDVLITDIKMPFMDGLQLSKIVRERIPGIKIVILSGHDEFEYAQQAIQLGVTEYLLKPVTVQDMHHVLQRVACTIERETREQAKLDQLRAQVQESRTALRERMLLKLLVGGITLADALDQTELLGMDLVARCYAVVVIRFTLAPGEPFDYLAYRQASSVVSNVVGTNPDVFVLEKDLEELVLILKGNTPEYLGEERDFLLQQIKVQVQDTRCTIAIGVGATANRIADIGQSFIEALGQVQRSAAGNMSAVENTLHTTELLRVDKYAVQDYLKCGVKTDFEDFFDAFLAPLSETAFQSTVVKNYIFLDLVSTTARFVQELGGDLDDLLPEIESLEAMLAAVTTSEQFRDRAQHILSAALTFRDKHAGGQHSGVIQLAKEYIDQNYADAGISLQAVAAHVGHSMCHFSTVFGEQMGKTFKEYLTDLRIKRAKELLRTTSLRSSEISDRVGYNDPHYFSLVFRKCTGLSPKEFRLASQRAQIPA